MLNHMKKHAVQSFVAFESPVGHPAWPILRVAQATNAPIATKRWARSPNSMLLKPTFADTRFATRLNRSKPSWRRCGSCSKSSLLLEPAAARLPKRSATHSRAGRPARFLHEGGIELDQPG